MSGAVLQRRTSFAKSIHIRGEEVEIVERYTHLRNRLDWRINTDTVYKKGTRRLFCEDVQTFPAPRCWRSSIQ